MLQNRRRTLVRTLMGAFAGALALLLGVWSWSSLANTASLTVNPTTARQNDTVTLIGKGFSPNETVSVWITYPDFRVYGVAEFVTDGDGSFSYPYLPDFLGATFTPTGKYTYTAHGQSSGREVYANLNVQIDQAPGNTSGVTLKAEPGKDSQGSYFVFRGSGYWGGEEVALWIRYPDNTVADMGRTTTGPSGSFEYVIYVTGIPVGHYALTGRGLTSGLNGIADFDVTVGDLTVASGAASLHVGPSPDTQRSYASFLGAGFQPSEIVSVWVTLPDYSTLWIGDVQADDAGKFDAVLYLSEQEPVGRRTYTAYGNMSGLRAIADYTLQPGSSADGVYLPAGDALCTGENCW